VGPTTIAHQQLLVELFSWWTAPGEAEALQALVDAHKASYPDARLFNAAAASGTRAKQILYDRLAHDDPPDLYQENVHDLREYIQENPHKFQSLNNLFEARDLRKVVFPEVLGDITIDGQIYAMPVNLHRENTLIYHQGIFDAHRLSPPASLAEFMATCEKLRSAGITPVATAYQGWILRIMFYSLAMGKMGAQAFHAYFRGKMAPDDIRFQEAIDVFEEVLGKYTNSDAGEDGFNWTNAAQAVYNGDAAMFLHGDWAKGYLVQLGWRPGVDFGVVAAPGAGELFLYGVDVFALPTHAKSERAAREFLDTIASPAAQLAFNRLKGSSPMRVDVRKDQLDTVGRAVMADLEKAEIRSLVRTRDPWDTAMIRFARDRDKRALLDAFVVHPPQP
jgi:glucose/mannose transport system substrate-binding protein